MSEASNSLASTPRSVRGEYDPSEKVASTLFIGDLSIYANEENIMDLFLPFGPIVRIKIKIGEKSGMNLCYGFVEFQDQTSAARALRELNGVLHLGRAMRIGWASYKKQKRYGSKDDPIRRDQADASIHIGYLAYDSNSSAVREDTLRIICGNFGAVLDCCIRKSFVNKDTGRQSGYGFVRFAANEDGVRSALACVEALRDVDIDGVNYRCSIGNSMKAFLMQSSHSPMEPVSYPSNERMMGKMHSNSQYQPVMYTMMSVPPTPQYIQVPPMYVNTSSYVHGNQIPYQSPTYFSRQPMYESQGFYNY